MFKSLKSIIISIIITFVFICFFVLIIINNNPQVVTEKNNLLENSLIYFKMILDSKFLLSFFIIELILLVRILTLREKITFKKIYIRDTKNVIEPVLAEAIIDKKIGIKELIMTCIIDLINKGNLKIINNDKIQLVKGTNLSSYEKNILDLLFSQEGEVISFEQIKNVFIHDNIKTKDFTNKLKNIKNSIIEKLINDGIYCERGETKLKRIKIICKIIYFYILLYLFVYLYTNIMYIRLLPFFTVGLILFAVYLGNRFLEGKGRVPLSVKIFIGIPLIFFIYFILRFNSILIVFSFLLLLNTLVIKLTQTHIFTLKGKEEYIKAQCLKAYIEDYGLMEEKDVESTIIWEDYLAYAVAFGISNKIADKINENLLNLNLALQEIDRVFRI